MANIYLEKILFDLLSPGIEDHPNAIKILSQENVSLQEEDHYIGEKYTIAKRRDEYRIAKTSEVQRVIGAIIDTGFKRYGVWRSGPNQHGNVALCAIPVRDFGKYEQGSDLLNSEKYGKNFSIAPCSSIASYSNPIKIINEYISIEVKSDIDKKLFGLYYNDYIKKYEIVEITSNKYSYDELKDIDTSSIKNKYTIIVKNDVKFKRKDILHEGQDIIAVVNYLLNQYDKDKSNVKFILKYLGKHGACYTENKVEDDKTHLVITVAPTYSVDENLSKVMDKDKKLLFHHKDIDESKELQDDMNTECIMKSLCYHFKPLNLENKSIDSPAYVISKKDIIDLYNSLQQKSKDKIPEYVAQHIKSHTDVFLSSDNQREELISTIDKFINSFELTINHRKPKYLDEIVQFDGKNISKRKEYQFCIYLFESLMEYIKSNDIDHDVLYNIYYELYRLNEETFELISVTQISLFICKIVKTYITEDRMLFNYLFLGIKIIFDEKCHNLYNCILIFNDFNKDKNFELIKFIEGISYKLKEIPVNFDKLIELSFFVEIYHLIDFIKEVEQSIYDKENYSNLWISFKDMLVVNKIRYEKDMPIIYEMIEKLDQQQSSDELPSEKLEIAMKRPYSEGDEVANKQGILFI